MKTLLALMILSTATTLANAQSIQFDDPILRGTGCPLGTTSFVISPDGDTMTLLFDEFLAEVPQFNGDNDNDQDDEEGPFDKGDARVSHKVCNIILKGQLPIGYKVKALEFQSDFRGAVIVEKGSRAVFKGQLLSFQGPNGNGRQKKYQLFNKTWSKPGVDKEFALSKSVTIPVKSNCSKKKQKKVHIKLRNIIKAKMNKRVDPNESFAFISLDTQDVLGNLKIKLHTRPCGGNGNGRRPGRR